jgi:hypothetical protein
MVDSRTSDVTRLVYMPAQQVPYAPPEEIMGPGLFVPFMEPTEATTETGRLTRIQQTERFQVLEVSWADLAAGEKHVLGRVDRVYDQYPVFFPGGRYGLVEWVVFDLDTGSRRPVTPDPGIDLDECILSSWTIFGAGDRLRFVEFGYEESGPFTGILEIDPETGRLARIDRLEEGVNLVSADGDRWLLTRPAEDSDQVQLLLRDHATGETRPLWTVPEDALNYLVAGGSRILSYSEAGGWRTYEIKEDLGEEPPEP